MTSIGPDLRIGPMISPNHYRLVRDRFELAQPIAEVQVNPYANVTDVVGWVQRDQDDRGLWEEIRIGDGCRVLIEIPTGLRCDADGSWSR